MRHGTDAMEPLIRLGFTCLICGAAVVIGRWVSTARTQRDSYRRTSAITLLIALAFGCSVLVSPAIAESYPGFIGAFLIFLATSLITGFKAFF